VPRNRQLPVLIALTVAGLAYTTVHDEPTAAADRARAPGASPVAPVTLALAGDVHFEGPLADRLADDPATALGPIAATLRRADLAMVNLETAVTERGTPQPKRFHFRAPATAFDALRAAGVDIATMANNHGMDYGRVGLEDSLAAARDAEFPVVGLGVDEDAAYAPYRVTVKGHRIAILAVTNVIDDILLDDWTASPDQPGVASAKRHDRLRQAMAEARRDSDTVVVYLHWGREGSDCPTDESRALERLLVEAGADVVVGAHTHVLLGGGWDPAGAYVDYGLGNFAFYASGVRPTTESGVLELKVSGRGVAAARWVPARIRGGVPVRQEGLDGKRILAHKEALRSCSDLLAAPPS
jgi:poly-gamma-glutamate synthesis protein (capsule biosynthesis protein)